VAALPLAAQGPSIVTTLQQDTWSDQAYVPQGQQFIIVQTQESWGALASPAQVCQYITDMINQQSSPAPQVRPSPEYRRPKPRGSSQTPPCYQNFTYTLSVPGAGSYPIDDSSPTFTEAPPAGLGYTAGAPFAYANVFNLKNPPPSDSETVYSRTRYQVIDVSALTVSGSITVTGTYLRTYASTTNIPCNRLDGSPWLCNYEASQISIEAQVVLPHFSLTQTPAEFRPQDARDDGTAATCAAYGENNCYVTFNAQLTAPFDCSRDAAWDLNPVFQFTLEHTAKQPAWLPGTSTNYTPPGTDLSLARNGPDPDYVFEPRNNPGLAAEGLSSGKIAPTNPATGDWPDEGQPPVAQATVTSRDYGGSANLRATVTVTSLDLDGGTHVATFKPDTLFTPDYWKVLKPPACAGTGIFASLPVDQDCNGIADSWEQPYIAAANTASQACGGPAVTSFLGTEDLERGYTCTSPQGDGWSVHDEYRGFHYVADDGVTPHWVSTDPVNKLDVFFWDAGFDWVNPPSYALLIPGFKFEPPPDNYSDLFDPSVYTRALRSILCMQGSFAEMGYSGAAPIVYPFPQPPPLPSALRPPGANVGHNYCYGSVYDEPVGGVNEYDPTQGPGSPPNSLKFAYRRVNAQQANANVSGDPTQGVKWFNMNSLTSAGTHGNHTALVYSSANPASRPGSVTLGTTYTVFLGNVPDARDARIDFNVPEIIRGAQEYRSMDPTTLAAQTLAHESGHWFSQLHPNRQPVYRVFDANSLPWTDPGSSAGVFTLQNNSATTYGGGTGNDILVGLELHNENLTNGRLNSARSEDVAWPGVIDIASQHQVPGGTAGVTVFQAHLSLVRNKPAVGNHDLWWVETMQNELMDWTANKNLTSPSQWHFDPANLNALCAKNPCN